MDMQDDILISYLLGEASTAEIKQVEMWRRADEAYNKRFEEFKLLWETSKNLEDPQEADTQASLKRFKEKVAERKITNTHIIKLKQRNIWMTIAASLMLIAGGAWFYISQYTGREIQLVTKNETKTNVLPDGSVITLNKLSLFEYPSKFTGNQRNVILAKGEAFFNVAHNKAVPFIISAGNATIRVVGTSFNVKNKNGKVEVIVETGIVQVSRGSNTILLKPGEKVLVTQNSALAKETNSDQLYTYYRSKEFVANNTPLWRMVEVLNDAYDSNIVIGRKELNDMLLNTTFKNESLDDILAIISRTFGATVEKKNGQIVIK